MAPLLSTFGWNAEELPLIAGGAQATCSTTTPGRKSQNARDTGAERKSESFSGLPWPKSLGSAGREDTERNRVSHEAEKSSAMEARELQPTKGEESAMISWDSRS
jgi:hypothetical protein